MTGGNPAKGHRCTEDERIARTGSVRAAEILTGRAQATGETARTLRLALFARRACTLDTIRAISSSLNRRPSLNGSHVLAGRESGPGLPTAAETPGRIAGLPALD
jgi:hypothetical protein